MYKVNQESKLYRVYLLHFSKKPAFLYTRHTHTTAAPSSSSLLKDKSYAGLKSPGNKFSLFLKVQ